MLQKYNFEPKNEGSVLLYSINTLVFGLPVAIIGLFFVFGWMNLSIAVIIAAIIVLIGGISYFYYFTKIIGISELNISDQQLILKSSDGLIDLPLTEARFYLFVYNYFNLSELMIVKLKNKFYFFRPNEDLKNFFQSKKNFKNYKILQITGEIILIILAATILISVL